MTSSFILFFCSGLTFAVGGINLAIGMLKPKDRSYLFFGLLSLLASVFLLIQLQSIANLNIIHTIDIISVILAVAFYTLFIWFIGEFTGFKKTIIQLSISFLAGLLVPLYFLVKYSFISWQLWEITAHTTILLISIYGIIAGLKGLNVNSKLWRIIYLFLMIALVFMTIILGLSIVLNSNFFFDPKGFISPLDFFPVLFSIIIGYKMSQDIIRSHQLDKEIDIKDRRWSSLMEKINLLVVELDTEGKIKYVNSYFNVFTGYSLQEIVEKNWFHLMLDDEMTIETKAVFSKILDGKEIPSYQNFIYTKTGEKKIIQWSNLHMKNHEGQIIGSLSIGTDVTDRESSFDEIKLLKSQLEKENLLLKEELHNFDFSNDIIGESDSLHYAIKRAIMVAETDSTVLLEGETGVGKELFANLIHRKSKRSQKPYIKVNCSAIPKELIESEFFGHEKGAFTGALKSRQGRFELADKGTIFLDEVGEIPYELQAKLLRIIQSGEFERVGSEVTKKVDVRIIAATNKDLGLESNKDTFRQDLYYRLNVYPITIPPLRHRKEDIPLLVRHFADTIGRKMGKKMKEISKADLSTLTDYNWPGNIRELENIIERAIINSSGNVLEIKDSLLKYSVEQSNSFTKNDVGLKLSDTEKNHILNILEICNWKINGENGAAKKLGIPPSTLRSKMKKLNIVRPD